MKLIIAVDVPYHVQIASTGIPLHQAKVEFCIPKNDVSFNFPAKAINDTDFVFTVTDAVKEYMNTTLEYKLYVYYGNARFEADTGSFNLINKESFDIEMKNAAPEKKKKLGETIRDKAKKLGDKKKKSTDDKKPKVTSTPTETTDGKKATVKASKPTPTPTIEPTTTLKEAKAAIKKTGTKSGLSKMLVTDTPAIEETQDANSKVKNILKSINKSVTPSAQLTSTPTVTEGATKTAGNFLEEVEKMREAQNRIIKNKAEKEKTDAKSQRVRNAIKKAEDKKPKK